MKSTSLVEISWEVCNQSGGIYTVLTSKLGRALEVWGNSYCLVGPYFQANADSEWQEIPDDGSAFWTACSQLRQRGLDARCGTWLASGKPRAVLLNPTCMEADVSGNKARLRSDLKIPDWHEDILVSRTLAFGQLVLSFLVELAEALGGQRFLVHFHEWMAATHLPLLEKFCPTAQSVFTTHATLVGRYLASEGGDFYETMETKDFATESRRFWIEVQAALERHAAQAAGVFTTVSEITARECTQFLGRKPDLLTPNGLNIQRFTALHEFQNLHQKYKRRIQDFLMGYFFPSYTFDLDQTLLFFSSGRYEFHNKGYDLTLNALADLNRRLIEEESQKTVVFFLITKAATRSINPDAFQKRALLEELRHDSQEILKDIGEKLFFSIASHAQPDLPDLNAFVEDYWRFRVRKTLQAWKSHQFPPIVTHNMADSDQDPILNLLRKLKLFNSPEDKVKIVYHPDFVSPMSPLLGLEYPHFVRGCHLGIFPSYYEPWGYTPLEAIASGVPTITSDLAGFGTFVEKNLSPQQRNGIQVVHRLGRSERESRRELVDYLWHFTRMDRRERIQHRNETENNSIRFDWQDLYSYYIRAYEATIHPKEAPSVPGFAIQVH